MFNLGTSDGPKPKCLVTSTKLSNFLDHEQPPTKKRPYSTILGQPFTHTLNLLLPEPAAAHLQTQFSPSVGTSHSYSLVHMKPLDLLSGAFFTAYIKSGNILMHSSGRPGIDTILTLSNGLLRIEVDKPTFERLGLEGKPMSTLGRKHVKARFAVELNLRAPAMVHGKKGFDRVVWAFRNVLVETVTWLFCDLAGLEKGTVDGMASMEAYAPVVRELKPDVLRVERALVPGFPVQAKEQEYAEAAEVLEWLSLTMLGSPRISRDDDVDAFLSRYQVPRDSGEPTEQNLVRLQWRGLIPPSLAHKILLAAMKAAGQQWVAINGQAFSREAYMILINDGHSTTWEYKD